MPIIVDESEIGINETVASMVESVVASSVGDCPAPPCTPDLEAQQGVAAAEEKQRREAAALADVGAVAARILSDRNDSHDTSASGEPLIDVRAEIQNRVGAMGEILTMAKFEELRQQLVQSDAVWLDADPETGKDMSLITHFVGTFIARFYDFVVELDKESKVPNAALDVEQLLQEYMQREATLFTTLSILGRDLLEQRKTISRLMSQDISKRLAGK